MDNDNKAVGIGTALLIVAIGAGLYFYKFASPPPAPAASPAVQPPAAAPETAPSAALPKLEESDGFVRGKAAALSSNPAFASWLKTDDLVARFAAAVSLIGQGRVPKDGLSFLAPHKKFPVRKTGETVMLDPRGYARYDAAAAAVGSIDAAAAARLFLEIKPLLQQAYLGLGEKNGDVQDAFARAAGVLLKTPSVEGKIALKEKGIVYAYMDDSLESLSPAQKQLLRMGPKNVALIQDKLREFETALGASSLRR